MQPRTAFALRAVTLSAVLYGVWWAIVTRPGNLWILEDAGFAVPVLGILLASRLDLRKRAWTTAALIVSFVLIDVLAELLGVRGVAETGATAIDVALSDIKAALYHVFRVGLPLGTLLVASRGDLRTLWQTGEKESAAFTCPVCGKRRVGLEAHIRDAHGVKALGKARARGQV